MDDRYALLDSVFEDFKNETIARSQVFSTPPWGVTDQDEFLNAVLIVQVDQSPLELLKRGQALENAAERKRIKRWGPRTLDVDVVTVFDEEGTEIESEDPVLTLPHPYAKQRAFVLVPWLDADPNAMLQSTPVHELIQKLDAQDVAAIVPATQ